MYFGFFFKFLSIFLLGATLNAHAVRFATREAADEAVEEAKAPIYQASAFLMDISTGECASATFLNPTTLITCAHLNMNPDETYVFLDNNCRLDSAADLRKYKHLAVKRIIRHPDYKAVPCGQEQMILEELAQKATDVDFMLSQTQVKNSSKRVQETGPDIAIVKLRKPAPKLEYYPAISQKEMDEGEIYQTEMASFGFRGLADGSSLGPISMHFKQLGRFRIIYSPKYRLLYDTHRSLGACDDRFTPQLAIDAMASLGDSGGSLLWVHKEKDTKNLEIIGIYSRSRAFNLDRNTIARQLLIQRIPAADIKSALEEVFVELPIYNVWTPVAPYADWIRSQM